MVTHTLKYKTVKCVLCSVWVQNFVWNFKGALWNFTQNFEPIQRKICILRRVKNFTTYVVIELWHLSETGPCPPVTAGEGYCKHVLLWPILILKIRPEAGGIINSPGVQSRVLNRLGSNYLSEFGIMSGDNWVLEILTLWWKKMTWRNWGVFIWNGVQKECGSHGEVYIERKY